MKGLVAFTFCIAAALGAPQRDETGKGDDMWLTFQSKQYAFIQEAKESYEASKYCEGLGGHLAVPRNDQENYWLSQKASENGGDQWWLGIIALYSSNDMGRQREFQGLDGLLNYTKWADGEPNNFMPLLGQEDCAALDTKQYAWNDLRCNTGLYFICEKDQDDVISEKTYKFTYFNLRARGEVGRLLFALANVKYVDNRIDFVNWPAFKPQTMWGVLPELDIGGNRLCQSNTIFRYLAREFDLMGSSERDEAFIDMIMGCMSDVLSPVYTYNNVKGTPYGDQLRNETMVKIGTIWLPQTQKFLTNNNNGDGWFVGDKPTLADAMVFHAMQLMTETFGTTELDRFPKLAANVKRFGQLPRIATWINSRPKTDY